MVLKGSSNIQGFFLIYEQSCLLFNISFDYLRPLKNLLWLKANLNLNRKQCFFTTMFRKCFKDMFIEACMIKFFTPKKPKKNRENFLFIMIRNSLLTRTNVVRETFLFCLQQIEGCFLQKLFKNHMMWIFTANVSGFAFVFPKAESFHHFSNYIIFCA